MVARVVPQSARRRHAESRKPDLRGVVARPKAPVLQLLGVNSMADGPTTKYTHQILRGQGARG